MDQSDWTDPKSRMKFSVNPSSLRIASRARAPWRAVRTTRGLPQSGQGGKLFLFHRSVAGPISQTPAAFVPRSVPPPTVRCSRLPGQTAPPGPASAGPAGSWSGGSGRSGCWPLLRVRRLKPGGVGTGCLPIGRIRLIRPFRLGLPQFSNRPRLRIILPHCRRPRSRGNPRVQQ